MDCFYCNKPIKDKDLVTFNDGLWYDGNWHRKCLTLPLAIEDLRQSFRKLGAAIKEAFIGMFK